MAGIVFLSTADLEKIRTFYLEEVGCTLWLDQGDCLIFQHENLLLGFMDRSRIDHGGLITFFYEEKSAVDRLHERFKDRAEAPPRMHPKYRIYHFFTQDPEGRRLEFQYFDHELPPY